MYKILVQGNQKHTWFSDIRVVWPINDCCWMWIWLFMVFHCSFCSQVLSIPAVSVHLKATQTDKLFRTTWSFQFAFCACPWTVRRSQSSWREARQTQGDHATSLHSKASVPGIEPTTSLLWGDSTALTPYYLLNVWQQFGDDAVRHSVHSVQSGHHGGGVEGEDYPELGATYCLPGIRLEGQITERCTDGPKKNHNRASLLFSPLSYLDAFGYQTADEVHEAQVWVAVSYEGSPG